MIIDSHVHLFAADTERFPLHPAAPYKPEPAPLESWLKAADGALIGGAVLVHAEPYQDDHRYVVHCLEAAPKRFRATCLFDCNCPDSPKHLAALVKTPGFVAARVHAYRDNHIPLWDAAEFKAFWRKAGELGLMLQVHMVPKFAGEVDKLAAAHPDFPVLIDHLGRPGQGTAAEHAGVLKLAERKNVRIKSARSPTPPKTRPRTRTSARCSRRSSKRSAPSG